VVIFAVKPQTMASVLSDLKDKNVFLAVTRKKIFISIAAGIPIKTLESYIYAEGAAARKNLMPILRVMPNTPALVRAGVSGLCANATAVPEDMSVARKILGAMGKVFECDEREMDAVTAVSGSGPAYCFYLAEAMATAAAELGLSAEDAAAMTTATLKGAVALLESQSETAAELRKKVTSPGGTTEAAIRVLDDHQVKQSIIQAVAAAARRSRELSA
jgi:pyrroline-5-carboxylate reductase